MDHSAQQRLHWWQTRWFVAIVALLSAVPLLWPDIPPLLDLPGHMGRYRVQQMAGTGQAPWFADWYNFDWSLIGNLGVDLLVWLFEPLFGLEPTVKLIALAIPPLTAVGLLWIAREVHGRIPATALFALPIVYSFPLHFGFANFALSMALALNAFALWLRLGRQERFVLRGVLFVPIGALIWLTHTFGWGTLGVLAASAELIREHDRRKNWFAAAVHAGLHCLVLAPPAILMLLWRSGGHVGGQTADWFNWRAKMLWLTMTLRDRWQLYDLGSVAIFYLVLFKGVRDPNIGYSRNLGLSALFLIAVYIFLPRIVFGSAYADMRLVPYLFGICLIALRPKPGVSMRHAATLAAIGMAIFVARIGATTASFLLYDRDYDRELQALDHLPIGARLVTFVGETCYNEWKMTRLQHLPGIALERRLAYANDQWSMAGGQLLTVRYTAAKGFAHDPSEIVTDVKCPREYWRPIAGALYKFPREAFDYVWLIRPPAYDRRLEQGLIPVWRNGRSALFRIDHRVPRPSLTWSDLGNRPFARPKRRPAILRRT